MRKWHRSNRDKYVTGLIGGMAERWNMDASLLRILFVISVFATSGTSLLFYFIALLFVPKESIY
jgi:phage shock protein C